jgi:hypothetical protein
MKKLLLLSAALFSFVASNAQWTGHSSSSDVTSMIYRTGIIAIDGYNVAQIRLNSSGTYYGNIGNPSAQVWSLGYGVGASAMEPVLNWTSSGNVGIRTTTPQRTLDVRTGLNNFVTFGEILGTSSSDNWSGIHFGYMEPTNNSYRKSALAFERLDDAARGKVHILNNSGYNSTSATLADSKVTIDYTGNVGIGTTSPNFKLHIADGNGGDQLKFQRGTGVSTILQDNNQNNLYLEASAGLFLNALSGSNVGIGTNTPAASLHIKSAMPSLQIDKSSNAYEALIRFAKAGTTQFYIWTDNGDDALKIESTGAGDTDDMPRMEFPFDNKNIYMAESGGNVGIGTTSPDQKLTVNGTIHTKEVIVDLSVPGPDYVFEKDYNLLSLSEIEKYIVAHKHLPEVPSAKEMEENGVNLKEMNMLLLKKVEELTLYLIEMNEKINALQKRDEVRQQEITALKSKK